ncbi:gamma-glutamylcyclotransferase [Paracoccus sp. Z118]|uniref:gamma-glutamylcyclotransferase n=1 Tax=Paracoccus sp. Z118 TaxID=2851017 RepID=UPI001C2C6ABA|nr:gamma-glutamylcyclotransferase [Paracoccus sp. Z118]MBV0891763.1 gamma-glutamylcyclotransferase [Paracoccus sp. Z118]
MPPEHWVFAYGSLMWDPRVPVAETAVAHVEGFQRRFCLRSVQYRGTAEAPGLVLGLDPCGEGACSGVALRIEAEAWPEALAEIRRRELSTEAYRETEVTLSLADGRRVLALAYVMRLDHWQYAGDLSETEQAEIIARAHGGRGPNAEYLFNTVAHLDQLGLPDADLTGLADRVRAILATPHEEGGQAGSRSA